MKMLKAILMTTGLTVTGVAMANTPVNQAAIAPATLTTVKHALTAKDNTPVKLHGQVVKSLGDEKYQFRDNTGSITVDVDDELWQGRPISANTNVTLIGEVDIDYKPLKRVEIEVDQVQF
jgi:uncharacterized protein (TIGR00156 family)